MCPTCAGPMTWVKVSAGQNRTTHCWRCPGHKGRKLWPRSGSFFEDSKLPFKKLVVILYCWANDIPNHTAVRMVGINQCNIVQWYKVSHCLFKSYSNLNFEHIIQVSISHISFGFGILKSHSSLMYWLAYQVSLYELQGPKI